QRNHSLTPLSCCHAVSARRRHRARNLLMFLAFSPGAVTCRSEKLRFRKRAGVEHTHTRFWKFGRCAFFSEVGGSRNARRCCAHLSLSHFWLKGAANLM